VAFRKHKLCLCESLHSGWYVQAVIYKASGTTSQYGYDQKVMHGGAHAPWMIWLPTQQMWQNPLTGWDSSSDVAQSSFRKMTFKTAQQAAEFLSRQGFSYVIEENPENYKPTQRPTRFATYGDNFRCALRHVQQAARVQSLCSPQEIASDTADPSSWMP
jgi:hypothetical protein